jgi:hypothetical protein
MPQIRTSRLDIQYNIEAIKRDFSILKFEFSTKEKKWRGARQLDILTGKEIHAEAAVYGWFNDAYALFRREKVAGDQLIKSIRTHADFEDVTVHEVEPRAHYNGDYERYISGLFLARLMLNSLGASRSRFREYQYSNLTGDLLLVPDFKTTDNSFEAFQASIERADRGGALRLGLSLATFRKKIGVLADRKKETGKRKEELSKALKKGEYTFHAGRGCLQRWISDEQSDPYETYIRCGLTGTHASRCFLDFMSLKKFDESRAGMLLKITDSINTELKGYMSVDFSKQPYDQKEELNNHFMDSAMKIRKRMEGHKIHIVDRVGDDESKQLVGKLMEKFSEFVPENGLLTAGSEDVPWALNYRIVHSKAFYDANGIEDEYRPSEKECQRQHLTLEGTSEAALGPVVKTVLKEQLIKHDIGNKKMTLLDWESLGLSGQWTFGVYKKETPLSLMTIEPDGSFEFEEVIIDGLRELGKEHQRYVNALDAQEPDASWKIGLDLEGFVVSPDGHINFIYCSDEITIPSLGKIRKALEQLEAPLPSGMQTGSDFAKMVQAFAAGQESENPKIEQLVKTLLEFENEPVSKKQFKRMLNEHVGKTAGDAKKIREYLWKQHKVRVHFPKTVDDMKEHFDANLNIKYFGVSSAQAYYFVGDRRGTVQQSFRDACHLRKIIADPGSQLVFDQLLQCMNVDFVRTGQSTVVPVPFKYLREYRDTMIRSKSFFQ